MMRKTVLQLSDIQETNVHKAMCLNHDFYYALVDAPPSRNLPFSNLAQVMPVKEYRRWLWENIDNIEIGRELREVATATTLIVHRNMDIAKVVMRAATYFVMKHIPKGSCPHCWHPVYRDNKKLCAGCEIIMRDLEAHFRDISRQNFYCRECQSPNGNIEELYGGVCMSCAYDPPQEYQTMRMEIDVYG